jgi:putative DNA primase/helicase
VLREARGAYAAGLCILPVRADGSKAPAVRGWGTFKDRRPTVTELRAMRFDRAAGFGIVAGHGVDAWDFDEVETFDRFLQAASETGLADLVVRIRAGYEDQTPRDGRRWLVRYTGDVDWRDETLAARVGADGTEHVLIELPTFAIVAPSIGRVHPNGRPYVRQSGGFGQLATYTAAERDALHTIARRFDERPVRQEAPLAASQHVVGGLRPGDMYNQQASWPEVLEPHGWRVVERHGEETRWARPGKDRGTSATTNYRGTDLLHVFSSSTPFQTNRSYDKFAAYALLTHGGNFDVAARALADRGYGSRPAARSGQAATTSGDGTAPVLQLTALRELLAEPDDVIEWVVQDRVPHGGVALLAGKPKSGKSTLVRDLALQVAQGGSWLGWPCTAGSVWYLVLEDKRSEVRRHFALMGGGSEAIWFVFPPSGHELLAQLQQRAEIDQPALIIVDTLQRLICAHDVNDYAEVTTRLTPLLQLARKTGAAVLLVHHAGKGDRGGIDSVLGSTALAGSVDNIFLLARSERYRLLSTLQRIGPELPPTLLTLDAGTGRVVLGSTREDADTDALKAAMLAALEESPEALTEDALAAQVEGPTRLKRAALRALAASGQVTRTGAGTRGHAYRYAFSRLLVPDGIQERANEKPEMAETAHKPGSDSRSADRAGAERNSERSEPETAIVIVERASHPERPTAVSTATMEPLASSSEGEAEVVDL